MSNEQVVALKEKGEALMVQFANVLKEITELGYKVVAQQNTTLYVFKDTREAYGEVYNPPKPPLPDVPLRMTPKVVNLDQGQANAG